MSDDWEAKKREETETRLGRKFGSISLREHRVGIERVQRIHLGIDSEPMDFNEQTLANMIQDVADECDEDSAFTLHAVARALRGEDDDHHLVLRQNRPGKWQSPTEFEEKASQEMSWLWTLAALERQGTKTEAAIAKIAQLSNVSRATVFAGVKRAEQTLERAWTAFNPPGYYGPKPQHLTNPRPDKKRNS